MNQRQLGSTGRSVSVISYGAWPLSDSEPRPDEADAIAAIHAALDGGATLIDTADAYCLDDSETGHNERLIAKALTAWPGDREAIVVATKGGYVRPNGLWQSNAHPEHLKQACDRSLANLGVERIDLYQLHGPDPQVAFEDSVGALAELKQAGKVRWVGLSNVSVAQIEAARKIAEVVSVQNRLNPYFREAVHEGVVGHCDREGVAFLAYSPLGGGRLTKRLPEIAVLQELAAGLGATPHAVTLAWVLAQGDSVIAIPAGRHVENILDSQSAASLDLTAEDLAAIDTAHFPIG